MTEQLLNHIRRHNLCKTTDKILLAVSGGIDSMVMLHLFRQAGFQAGVAHCNFQLRGEASDADEELVRGECSENNVAFHVRRFQTEVYAKDKGLSIQMAARALRYPFFAELARQCGYDYIATAHHHSDSVETVFLNLIKGTGMDGVTGIPAKTGNLIRPMLFATKTMILEYAKIHQVRWREDESNSTDDYQRNYLRHNVVPLFTELNPNFENTFFNTLQRLAGSNKLLRLSIENFISAAVTSSPREIRIDKTKLAQSPAPAVLLWELVKDKGFRFDQCEDIVRDHQAGKKFSSADHDLFIDRDHYIITRVVNNDAFEVHLNESSIHAEGGGQVLSFEVVQKEIFALDKNPRVAQLDFEKIRYPITWRPWRDGDSFIPFGMKHSKKVSDFLIDIKMPMPAKRKVTVLESGDEIMWVVGHRISDRFRVTERTSKVLTISVQESGLRV